MSCRVMLGARVKIQRTQKRFSTLSLPPACGGDANKFNFQDDMSRKSRLSTPVTRHSRPRIASRDGKSSRTMRFAFNGHRQKPHRSLRVFRRSQQCAGLALRAVPASAIPNENIVVKEGRAIFLGDPPLVTAQTGGRV